MNNFNFNREWEYVTAETHKKKIRKINLLKREILFSGDSDYLKLVEDCFNKGKSIRIYSFEDMLSWELKQFAFTHPRCNYILLDKLKYDLELVSEEQK